MGPEMIGLFVPLGGMAMIVALVIGRPAVKAWAKKVENESRHPSLPPEVASRLERMEQSIDAIAVEVERISEGQRFTTKLLADTQSSRALPGSSPARDQSAP